MSENDQEGTAIRGPVTATEVFRRQATFNARLAAAIEDARKRVADAFFAVGSRLGVIAPSPEDDKSVQRAIRANTEASKRLGDRQYVTSEEYALYLRGMKKLGIKVYEPSTLPEKSEE